MNVQKVMWTLGELELAYERHDMAGSFGTTDAYLALNPAGTVPTIQEDGLTLYESNACVRYLAMNHGKGTLAPTDPGQLALADQWMDWQTSTFGPAFFQIFFNMIRLPADKANEQQRHRGLAQTADLLNRLDAHLADSDFIVGDSLTMGDISTGTILYRYFELNIERPALPNVEAYYGRLTQRAAYRRHVMIPFGRNSEEWLVEEKRNAGIQ